MIGHETLEETCHCEDPSASPMELAVVGAHCPAGDCEVARIGDDGGPGFVDIIVVPSAAQAELEVTLSRRGEVVATASDTILSTPRVRARRWAAPCGAARRAPSTTACSCRPSRAR